MENTITARSAGAATIWSVYRPVEAYRELLPAGIACMDETQRLRPMQPWESSGRGCAWRGGRDRWDGSKFRST